MTRSGTDPWLEDAGYEPLKRYIICATGLAFYEDKDDDLSERVARRAEEIDCGNCSEYLALLRGADGDAELDRLTELLTIGETSFFRHAEVFDALRSRVLPELIQHNRTTHRLRIWSAGCSIGAEAYSIAILLHDAFGTETAGWDVSIVGTDINRQFLGRAHAGRFKEWDMRNLPADVVDLCFIRQGSEFVIRPHYSRNVAFRYHNLVRHPFPSLAHDLMAFDLILCRNVLIYFERSIVRQVVGGLYDCLRDGGWLLVGHAEPDVSLFRSFETVNVPGAVLYRRPPQPRSHVVTRTHPRIPAPPSSASDGSTVGAPASVATRRANPSSAPRIAPAGDMAQLRRLADAGRFESALARCHRLIVDRPQDAALHFYLGMLLEHLGRGESARAALRRAIDLDCAFVLAHHFLALHHQRRGDAARARECWQRVIQLLNGLSDDHSIAEADSLTVGDLRELTRSYLQMAVSS